MRNTFVHLLVSGSLFAGLSAPAAAGQPAAPEARPPHVKTVDIQYGDKPVRQDDTRQKVRLRFTGAAGDRVALRTLRKCAKSELRHHAEPVVTTDVGYYVLLEPGRYTFVYTGCSKPGRRDSLQLVRLVIKPTSVDGSVLIKARRGHDYGFEATAASGAWIYAQLEGGPGWTGNLSWHAYSGVTRQELPFVGRTALRADPAGPVLYVARGRGLTRGTSASVRLRSFGVLPAIDAVTEPTVAFPVTEPGRWMVAEMTLDEVTPHHMDVVSDALGAEWQALAISQDPQCSAGPPYTCDTDGAWLGYMPEGYLAWSEPFIPFLGGPNPWVVLLMVDPRGTGTVTVRFPWGTHHPELE